MGHAADLIVYAALLGGTLLVARRSGDRRGPPDPTSVRLPERPGVGPAS